VAKFQLAARSRASRVGSKSVRISFASGLCSITKSVMVARAAMATSARLAMSAGPNRCHAMIAECRRSRWARLPVQVASPAARPRATMNTAGLFIRANALAVRLTTVKPRKPSA